MTKALPHGARGISPSETPVVALPVSSEPAQIRPEDQTERPVWPGPAGIHEDPAFETAF